MVRRFKQIQRVAKKLTTLSHENNTCTPSPNALVLYKIIVICPTYCN